VPFRIGSLASRLILPVLFRVIFHRVLTVDTPMGRKARPTMISKGGPLIRVKPADLAAAGVQRAPRVTGVKDGRPMLADGRVLDVANVVWCTGFHAGLSWIDLPVRAADGEPIHERGIVPGQPGLYFVGQHFLYAFSSSMIHGVARDAERIATTIAGRLTLANAGVGGRLLEQAVESAW
jgi:putative flavoprotein involved in K+ transport